MHPAPTPRPSGADDRERLSAVVADALETFQQRDGYQKAVIVEILEDFGAILAAPLLAELAAERTAREAAESRTALAENSAGIMRAKAADHEIAIQALVDDNARLTERVAALEARVGALQDIENWLHCMRPYSKKATGGPWYHYDEVFRPQFGSGRVTEIQVQRTGKEIVCWGGFDGLPASTERKKNANAALMVEAVNGIRRQIAAMDRRALHSTKGGSDVG